MKTFTFNGNELAYLDDMYNLTTLNERRVEIPVALWWLDERRREHAPLLGPWRVLEVGNVLTHYGVVFTRRIVDLGDGPAWYQREPERSLLGLDTVENIDLFDVEGEFDAIVSISTVEHVQEAKRGVFATDAIEHLTLQLADGGAMLVTAPTGVDSELDWRITNGAVDADWWTVMKKGRDHTWNQLANPAVSRYGGGVGERWANAVFVAQFSR